MKFKILHIILIIIALVSNIKAQQQTLQSFYMFDNIYINPAIAGTTDKFNVNLTVRTQWVGIDNFPKTQILSSNKSIGANKEMGVGAILYNDMVGFERRTGISGVYSYKIKIGEKYKLSFGILMSAFQYSVNEGEYNIVDENDPSFTTNRESIFIPDANAGVYFYSKKYYVGYSATQLFKNSIKIDEASTDVKMVRHHYLLVGYNFNFGDNIKLEASTITRFFEVFNTQTEFTARIIYKNTYWFGLSSRGLNSVVVMAGFNYKKYSFGYAYDFMFSSLPNANSNSHEIFLRIDLTKNTR